MERHASRPLHRPETETSFGYRPDEGAELGASGNPKSRHHGPAKPLGKLSVGIGIGMIGNHWAWVLGIFLGNVITQSKGENSEKKTTIQNSSVFEKCNQKVPITCWECQWLGDFWPGDLFGARTAEGRSVASLSSEIIGIISPGEEMPFSFLEKLADATRLDSEGPHLGKYGSGMSLGFQPRWSFCRLFPQRESTAKKGWKVGQIEAMLPKQVSQPRLVGDKLLKLREAGGWYPDSSPDPGSILSNR